jgi:hypothetical protein
VHEVCADSGPEAVDSGPDWVDSVPKDVDLGLDGQNHPIPSLTMGQRLVGDRYERATPSFVMPSVTSVLNGHEGIISPNKQGHK